MAFSFVFGDASNVIISGRVLIVLPWVDLDELP